MPGFWGARDSNSGPCAYVARTLLSELPPSPNTLFKRALEEALAPLEFSTKTPELCFLSFTSGFLPKSKEDKREYQEMPNIPWVPSVQLWLDGQPWTP